MNRNSIIFILLNKTKLGWMKLFKFKEFLQRQGPDAKPTLNKAVIVCPSSLVKVNSCFANFGYSCACILTIK